MYAYIAEVLVRTYAYIAKVLAICRYCRGTCTYAYTYIRNIMYLLNPKVESF